MPPAQKGPSKTTEPTAGETAQTVVDVIGAGVPGLAAQLHERLGRVVSAQQIEAALVELVAEASDGEGAAD